MPEINENLLKPGSSRTRSLSSSSIHDSKSTGTASHVVTSNSKYKSIIHGLKDIYNNKIRPLEETYHFETFFSPPLSDAEIEAKPLVLLLGQYSTGKTSFVTRLLGRSYPGAHVGPEPTTDKFVAIMHGPDDRVIPGNAASTQSDRPFRSLSQFGSSFLSKFQLSLSPIPLLEAISFVDTPGVLSGEKQRLGRSYDFVKVCEWFAEKSDLILLFFDAHKLDISDEFKRVITGLRGHDEKIRVVLNKVDMVSNAQLLRVYGALMYSLGRVIQTPEVMRVYFVSISDLDQKNRLDVANRDLILLETSELVKDLHDLPRLSAVRKINELIKRCRHARVHAHIIGALKKEMPAMFGKSSKQADLLANLADIFTKVQKATHLPPGDFPDITSYKETLTGLDFNRFSKFSTRLMDKLESAMNEDLAKLMLDFPQGPAIHVPSLNPFDGSSASSGLKNTGNVPMLTFPAGSDSYELPSTVPAYSYTVTTDEAKRYERVFYSLSPSDGILSGAIIRSLFKDVALSSSDLAIMWNLADSPSNDGYLDMKEFLRLMKLSEVRLAGGPLPTILPEELDASINSLVFKSSS